MLVPPTTAASVQSGDLTLQDPDVATVHHTLQDVFNCMCLSEGVYKVVDFGEERATEILGAILEGFPPGLVSLKRVEWSRPDSNHRQAPEALCSVFTAEPPQQGSAICHVFTLFSYMLRNPWQICSSREKMLIACFPASSNKVEGLLPRVLPGGRTFCQGLRGSAVNTACAAIMPSMLAT